MPHVCGFARFNPLQIRYGARYQLLKGKTKKRKNCLCGCGFVTSKLWNLSSGRMWRRHRMLRVAGRELWYPDVNPGRFFLYPPDMRHKPKIGLQVTSHTVLAKYLTYRVCQGRHTRVACSPDPVEYVNRLGLFAVAKNAYIMRDNSTFSQT